MSIVSSPLPLGVTYQKTRSASQFGGKSSRRVAKHVNVQKLANAKKIWFYLKNQLDFPEKSIFYTSQNTIFRRRFAPYFPFAEMCDYFQKMNSEHPTFQPKTHLFENKFISLPESVSRKNPVKNNFSLWPRERLGWLPRAGRRQNARQANVWGRR